MQYTEVQIWTRTTTTMFQTTFTDQVGASSDFLFFFVYHVDIPTIW
jgi:hypothetical protein